ncbi:MAG: GNAT family N-acetyltransferase [Kineosporiaceae bacterium]|jgi:GNAT superfamily N-acetyltransferase
MHDEQRRRAVGAVTVRPARDSELDAAGDVVRQAYAADGLAVGGYLDVLANARDRARDATVAVAVSPDDEVLGSVTFALPGSPWAELSAAGEAEFRALGVAPSARGRGVGLALARWCVDEARRTGASRLVLCSMDVMHAAHRLYGVLGFSRRPDLDWEPEPGVRLLGFDLDLRSHACDAPADGPTPPGRPAGR